MNTGFAEVMEVRGRGLPEPGEVTITGADPVFSTRFRPGETCAAVLAGVGTAVSDIWELKTGRRQKVAVDVRKAAGTLRSAHYVEKADDGGTYHHVENPDFMRLQRMSRPWPTKDGRHFLPHFSLPHLETRVLGVLECDAAPESVARAVSRWNALELEAAIDRARACGAMVRSNAEWLAEPHGRILKDKPIVEIVKIGDSAPEPMAAGERPLSGIRALDLTRILAGPIAARTLAEHGADVLMVGTDGVPQILEHIMDTGHGKRSCYLDLKTEEGAERLRELVRGADVFSQGYRPGALDGLGFGPEQLAQIRPGIVYCSISCFGADGPFSHRAGWEQIGQVVTGICHEGGTDRPKLLPAAVCDYTTGYLGAYGILLALARRAREGGSYHVRVSLCQSGMFIYRQGRTDYTDPDMDLSKSELDAYRIVSETPYGTLKHLAPVVGLSETPPYWAKPAPILGSDAPEWLDREA